MQALIAELTAWLSRLGASQLTAEAVLSSL